MQHPQPATPIVTDNSTSSGIANETVKQKRSKAMDMRFYWIRDRVRQGQFHIYWQRGEANKDDYFTKHHAQKHHKEMRKVYFHQLLQRQTFTRVSTTRMTTTTQRSTFPAQSNAAFDFHGTY